MLILTRRAAQSILIDMGDVDPRTPVGELFANGPIGITVTYIKEHQVRIGIQADPRFLILRSELVRTIRRFGKYSTG